MKMFLRSIKFLMMFIGGVIILLAFDSLFGDANVWEKIGGFVISTIPGILLMAIVYFLWCKENLLGWILVILGIAMMFFFRVFVDFPNEMGGMIIFAPIFITGVILVVFGRNKQKGCCKIK